MKRALCLTIILMIATSLFASTLSATTAGSKIEKPVTINGVTIEPGKSPSYQSGDKLSFTGPASLTIKGSKYIIGASSEVRILNDGAIEGKTGEEFQIGRFAKGQIPPGITFKFTPPDKMTFGQDADGKEFYHPALGKFYPYYPAGITSNKLDIKLNTDCPPDPECKATITTDAKLVMQIAGKFVDIKPDIKSELEISKTKDANTKISGRIFEIGPKETVGEAGPLQFINGEAEITNKGEVIARKGNPKAAEGRATIKTPSTDAKSISRSPDGGTKVKSTKPSEGTNELISIVTEAEKAVKKIEKQVLEWAVSSLGTANPEATLTNNPDALKEKAKPKEIKISPHTGDLSLNPGDAQLKIKLQNAIRDLKDEINEILLATGDGQLKFNLNKFPDSVQIGESSLIDILRGYTLPDIGLNAVLGAGGKALAKKEGTSISKSASPPETPPRPKITTRPTPPTSELESWYTSDRGKTKSNNFLNALSELPDENTANQWRDAIIKKDYITIKQIQSTLGTDSDGMLGGGSLRALKNYIASMKAPVTTEDEPTPTIRASKSALTIPAPTTTTLDMESLESMKFQYPTADQKKYIRNAYNKQLAERMKLTPSQIPPAVQSLPTLRLSEAPKGAKTGDVLMRPEGRSARSWLKYNINTQKYMDMESSQTYTPFQVSVRDSILIK